MTKYTSVSITALAAFSMLVPMAAFAAGPAAINLGTSGNFTLLSKTGISTTGTTAITGDIGVSPAAATYITGFSLNLVTGGAYSTSPLVTGKVYAPGYADPTAANLTAAISDMQTAYTDGAGRSNPTATELGAGNIGGLTITPGLYKWGTGVTIPTDVTLSGGANDVWIFQIAQTLTVSSGVHINLTGGAQAGNVYWVVAGQTTLGTTVAFKGILLDQTAIVLNTGASLSGRALAQTAITLDSNSVTAASASAATVTTPAPVVTPPTAPAATTPATTSSNTQSSGTTGSNATVQTPATQTGVTTTSNNSATVTPTTPASSAAIKAVLISLSQGSKSSSVTTLQQFLISQNAGTSAQALAAVGATGYFGALTRAALAEFQAKAGISPAIGNFGPITRAYISAHF